LRASNAEIWATSDILDLIRQANEVKQVEAKMLWTRYRAHTRLAQELSALASEELGLGALAASTGMRVAYMQALGDGLTVTELADTSARDEVKALTKEVVDLLGATA
jgi:chromosome partitioning protein